MQNRNCASMRKRKQNKSTNIAVDNDNILMYKDPRITETMYTLELLTAGSSRSDVVFQAKQVAIDSGNVLCHDTISLVDILLSLKYNFNCRKITLCKDTNCYDFDKAQLVEYIDKVAN